MVLWESFGPRRTGTAERHTEWERVTRRAGSQVVFLRIFVVVRFGLGCGFLVFHRLLHDLLLDERLGGDRLANPAARNRVRCGSSGGGARHDGRRGLRRRGSLGRRGPTDRLAGRGWDLDDGRPAPAAPRWALPFAHGRSALVAEGCPPRG